MNIVDISGLLLILLCILIGFKRGVIKSLVKLVGLIVCVFIAYSLKGMLASWLIKFMPFFNFSGIFNGVKAVNILFYEVISFALIFVILFCILNIIASVAGIFDKILKLTIILAIPDKILGALVGLIEGCMLTFFGFFMLSQIPQTSKYVFESKFGIRILERTPIIRTVLAKSTLASEEIYQLVDKYKNEEDKTNFNVDALQILIKYKIITAEEVEKLEEDNKLGIQYVQFK